MEEFVEEEENEDGVDKEAEVDKADELPVGLEQTTLLSSFETTHQEATRFVTIEEVNTAIKGRVMELSHESVEREESRRKHMLVERQTMVDLLSKWEAKSASLGCPTGHAEANPLGT
jgi:hypothetical protein